MLMPKDGVVPILLLAPCRSFSSLVTRLRLRVIGRLRSVAELATPGIARCSATGGVAFTNVRADTNFLAIGGFPQTLASDSKNLVGGTIGAGVEYAFLNNLSLGVEGRYTWYGRQTFNAGSVATIGFPLAGPFTFASSTRSVNVETAEVMAKLNWKFNSAAVVAKY